MKTLVLAEKPSVAKEIARVLKCSNKSKGYLEGSRYVVTWALGHLVTLAEPDDYDKKLKEWRMEDLPMLPHNMKLKVIKQTSHQFRTVNNLMKRNDINELIIATDAGREGELVARWIMVLGGWKKPFRRLWISSQTDKAIQEGFQNLKPGPSYNDLFDAAVCRAEADWLIGLNVTRALTCKFNAQLTAGRVQTPTLAMITDRENEIKNFIPVDYWTIQADFEDYFGEWRNKKGNGRLFNYSEAEKLVEKVRDKKGTVKEVKVERKNEPSPLAYDLTELQRDANRRYGFSAHKTLSVLQNLYERHKIVTYPRTDSRYITTDIVPTLPERLKAMAAGPYVEYTKNLLKKPLSPTKRFVDNNRVSDHHAIIPTEQPLKLEALTGDEKKLYDLIARRFIAVLYPPYRYDRITLITTVEGEDFYSRGKSVVDSGWRSVTTKTADREDGDEELLEQVLAMQNRGDVKPLKNVKLKKSRTNPPPRYTEATLLTAMEGAGKFIEDEELRESIKGGGLGTPATRADIIEKLLYNSYVERRGKELVPMSKGIQLIGLVPEELKSAELTARWEQRLSNIARGKERRKNFIEDIRKDAGELVDNVKEDESVYRPDNVTKTKCPVCGKFMLLVNGKRGKMLACPDRACGYRQPENQDNSNIYKKSKSENAMNKRLISKFSDNQSVGTSLGDLLKAAMEEKDN